MDNTLYIVSGMHRSGTSAITRMLEVYGISIPGELIGPAADNEKGFFEDRAFSALNNQILEKQGLTWDSLNGFFLSQSDFSHPRFNHLKKKARGLLEDRAAAGLDWAFKDPRICRLTGFWLPLIQDAGISFRFVIAVRRPSEVAGSLAARDNFPHLKSLYLWFLHNLNLLDATSDYPRAVVSYESLLREPESTVQGFGDFFPAVQPKRLNEFVQSFLSEKLHHNQEIEIQATIAPANELYRALMQSGGDVGSTDDLKQQFLENSELLNLLELNARREKELIAEKKDQYADLTAIIDQKDQDIAAFKTYQDQLKEDLASARQWSDKLIGDIADLTEIIDQKDQDIADLTEIIDQKDQDIAAFKTYQDQLKEDLASARQWSDKLIGDIADLTEIIDQKDQDIADLTEIIDQKDQDIAAFKTYQDQLKEDLASARQWSDKLIGDIADLTEIIDQKDQDIAAFKTYQDQLKEDLASARQWSDKLTGDIDKLTGDVEKLTGDMEKYRLEVVTMKQSHSWRVTAPMRWLRRVVQKAPGWLYGAARKQIRDAVHSLPFDSMLRQSQIRFHERAVALLQGDIDNHSTRESHRAIIGERDQMLGEKQLLPDDDLPGLDLSIVTYNSEKWLDQFVESLHQQDYPLGKLHLVFVDNGSSDATVEKIRLTDWTALGSVNCLENSNVGFGAGHNRGISEGEEPLVLVTNIDLQFHRDSLRQAVSFAVQDDASVASWEFRQSPYEHPKFYDPVTLQTAWSAHACILLRREVFEAVGGYEKKIFMYGEDVELSYRFRSCGYKLRYLPRACVDHFTYKEAGEFKPMQYQGSILANAYLRLRYGSMFDAAKILPMYAVLISGLGGVPEHRKLIWQNLFKVLLNAVYFLRQRRSIGIFSFLGWDYDKARAGAFYESKSMPSEKPMVSVITRTYRGRDKLLLQCMQSVAHQTYPDIEHVIVEDGSDSMRSMIEQLKVQYPGSNIHYIPLEKVGRCHAGNRGLEESRGKYLAFLDDDDLFFADHIEVCVAELETDDSVSATYGLAWEVETEFEGDTYEERSHGTPAILHQHFDRDTLFHHNYIPVQAIVFHRELYKQHGGFDPELDNLEDWNLWIRYASTSAFKLIEKTTSMYRTPWNIREKSRRQVVLNSYLETAMAKNKAYEP